MKLEKVGVKVIPDRTKLKKNNKYALKLRVSFKSVRKYYYTTYDANDQEWQAINSAEAKGRLRTIKNEIAVIESKAQKCCDNIRPFSYAQFEFDFFNEKAHYQTIEKLYGLYIEQLKTNKQYGTIDSYKTAISSLKKYKSYLKFEDVTPEFLQGFENWMLSRGKSITTVGIYLRTLRAVINLGKSKGILDSNIYPFGRRKYVLPTGLNVKKALEIQQIKQIFDYEVTEGSGMQKAKDFWIFSYLCNGMNIMDIGQLKQRDVHPKYITFNREKTKRATRGNPVIITIIRNPYIDSIIRKWGRKTLDPDEYLFGIVDKSDPEEVVRKKIKQFTDVTNDWTKKIGKALGFEMNLTSYVARHSFATILVRSGAPLKLASQTLGHQSITTTEKYFAGFDLAAQEQYVRALTNF